MDMRITKRVLNIFQEATARIQDLAEEKKYKQIASHYDWNGYKRIYLIHIRTTGGTSLNHMFLSLANKNSNVAYTKLANKPGNRIIENGLIFVGWNTYHINRGHYFYGFSHTPLHKLSLPSDTFIISCFRDPAQRVISHFNMLMYFRINNIDHPCMITEGAWLGNSFDDFLNRIPKSHLMNQFYMFSPTFNIHEAIQNVQGLSHYFFNDDFETGVKQFNHKTNLNLIPIHTRKANYHEQIPDKSLGKLKDMLTDEYIFLDQIKSQLRP